MIDSFFISSGLNYCAWCGKEFLFSVCIPFFDILLRHRTNRNKIYSWCDSRIILAAHSRWWVRLNFRGWRHWKSLVLQRRLMWVFASILNLSNSLWISEVGETLNIWIFWHELIKICRWKRENRGKRTLENVAFWCEVYNAWKVNLTCCEKHDFFRVYVMMYFVNACGC